MGNNVEEVGSAASSTCTDCVTVGGGGGNREGMGVGGGWKPLLM